jgi:hypothetical protein
MAGNCVGTTSTLLIKKVCFDLVGGFDETLPSFQDHDMWIRIARMYAFECISQSMVLYRVHGKKIWTDIHAMSKGMDRMLAKYGDSAIFRRSLSYSYLRLGVECTVRGDTKRGRRALRRAIGLHPYEVRHYFNLGLSLLGSRGFRAAKEGKESLRVRGNRRAVAVRA